MLRMLRGDAAVDGDGIALEQDADDWLLLGEMRGTDWFVLSVLFLTFAYVLFTSFVRSGRHRALAANARDMPRVDWAEVKCSEACMVCLESFAQPRRASAALADGVHICATSPSCVFVLPCNHAAHSSCLQMWFEQQEKSEQKPSCPYCRQEVGGGIQTCRIARAKSSSRRVTQPAKIAPPGVVDTQSQTTHSEPSDNEETGIATLG
jgi:hypothetical protein